MQGSMKYMLSKEFTYPITEGFTPIGPSIVSTSRLTTEKPTGLRSPLIPGAKPSTDVKAKQLKKKPKKFGMNAFEYFCD